MKKIVVLLLALTFVLSSCFSGNSLKKDEKQSVSQSEDKKDITSSSENSTEKSLDEVQLKDLKDKELVKAVFEVREDSPKNSYMLKYTAGVMEGGAYTTIVYKDGDKFRADNIDEAGFYEINVYDPVKKYRYKWDYAEMSSPDEGEVDKYSGRIYAANSIKEEDIVQIPSITEYSKDDFSDLKSAKMEELDGQEVLYMEVSIGGSDKKIDKIWYSLEKDFILKLISTDEQGNDRGVLIVHELEIGGNYLDKMTIPEDVVFINTTLKDKELIEHVYDKRPDNSDRSYRVDFKFFVKDSESGSTTIYKNGDGILKKSTDVAGIYHKLYLNSSDESYLWYEGSNSGSKTQAGYRDRIGYPLILENYADDNFSRITKANIIEENARELLYFEAEPIDGNLYKEQVWYSIEEGFIIRNNEIYDGEIRSNIELKILEFDGDYTDLIRLPDGVEFEEDNPFVALAKRVYKNRLMNPNRSFAFDYQIKYEDESDKNSKGYLYYDKGKIRTEKFSDNVIDVSLYLKDYSKLYKWSMGNFDESGGDAVNIEDSGSILKLDEVNLSKIIGMPDFDELAKNDFEGLLVAEMINFRDEEVLYMEFTNRDDNSLRDMIWYSPEKDLILQAATVYQTGAGLYFAEVYNETFDGDYTDIMRVPDDVSFSRSQGASLNEPKNLARKTYREMNKEQPFRVSLTGIGLYIGQRDKSKFVIARDINNKYLEKSKVGGTGKSFLLSKALDKVQYSWATVPNAPEATRVQGKINLSKSFPVEMMSIFENNDFADLKVCEKRNYKGQGVIYFESVRGKEVNKMWFSLKDSMPLEVKTIVADRLTRHLVTDSYEVGGDYSEYFKVPDVKFTQTISR